MSKTLTEKEERQELFAALKERNVTFSYNTSTENLRKLVEESEGIPVKQVTPSTDYFEEIASQIRKETEARPKVKSDKDKVWYFISKYFTLSISPQGVSKKGKIIRYVKGLSTLDIGEQRQQADTFNLDAVIFNGVEGTEYLLNGFVGKSMLRTADATLAKFLMEHERYGSDFVVYDKDEQLALEVAESRKVTLAQSAVHNADERDLVRVLTYLDLKRGHNSYRTVSNTNYPSLVKKCLMEINKDIDSFVSSMESKESKIIYLINIGADKGILVPSTDGRKVHKDTGAEIIRSSVSKNWQDDMRDYLVSEQGASLLRELVTRTGYVV